jgi:hypothetical protein
MSINHITSLPLGVAIQRGNIPNFSGIQKFGYNLAVGTSFETSIHKDYFVPAILSEKSDLEIRAKADATTAISAGFQLILEKVVQS